MRPRAISSYFKYAFLALFASVIVAVIVPSAHADFYNSNELALPNDSYFNYFDTSDDGSVVVTVDGCIACERFKSGGLAYLSTNGGATFASNLSTYNGAQYTPISKQSWRGVDVSSDGQTIMLMTRTTVYISTNKGGVFSAAFSLQAADIGRSDYFVAGAMTWDGKTIFIATEWGEVWKYSFNNATRRWARDFEWIIPNRKYVDAIAVDKFGQKVFLASEQGGIYRIANSSISEIPNTTYYPDSRFASWMSIKCSDSGNEVVALAYNENAGDGIFKSTDGGLTFTQITTFAGQSALKSTAIDISRDGNVIAVGTKDGVTAKLFTQHGKTSSWYERENINYYWNYDQIRMNSNGSTIYTQYFWGAPLRVLKGSPEVPISTGVDWVSSTSLKLNWGFTAQPGSDSIQQVDDVDIQYSTSSSGPWVTFTDGVAGGASGSITATGLNSLTNYYFRIRAKNYYGASAWSAAIGPSFTNSPPSKPDTPTAIVVSDKSVIVARFSTPSSSGGSEIKDHEWEYSVDSGTTWTTSGVNYGYMYLDGSKPSLKSAVAITDMTPGVAIQIHTRSYNGIAWSDWSFAGTFTAYRIPSAPTSFTATINYTTATLTWSPPSYLGGGQISYYLYTYKRSIDSTWNSGLSTTNTSATITGLTGGYSYDFSVKILTTQNLLSLATYQYYGQAISPPTKLSITRNSVGPKSSQAFTTQPQVTLLDASNQIVSSDSKTVIVAEINKGGVLIGTDSATAVNGVVTFSNLGIKGAAGTQYVITYRSGNLLSATETLTLLSGPIASMKFTQNSIGGAVSVVFPTQPQIEIVDSDGNRVTSDETTTVTLNTSQGFLWDGVASSPTATAVHGLASFSGVRINGANGTSALFSYTAAGLSTIQETITITTGPASTFTRTTRAADAYIGGSFGTQPIYQVTDASGNVVTTGEYYMSISPSQGTLYGKTTIRTVNGVGTYTDLSLTGVNSSQLVILTVTSPGFTPYTGDSIVTRQGRPKITWNDLYIPRTTSTFTIPKPESSTAGTFTYSSSNTNIISISGSTASVVGTGTATITATFTPADTTNYTSGETITALFTVTPADGTLIVSVPGSVAQKGISNTLTATSSSDGTVTFYANGKKIAGCISRPTQNLSATCSWKPTVQGSVTITAILIPTDESASAARANLLNVAVIRRTGRR